MRRLIGVPFSPWTEKARWALDHHKLGYTFRKYQPLIDEPWLRMTTRNFTRRPATVPVLLDDGRIFPDSLSIAKHADRGGGGPSLFPDVAQSEIDGFHEKGEVALGAGRALFFSRLATDEAALLDYVPRAVPEGARPLLRPLARSGVVYLRAKYGIDEAMAAKAYDALDSALSSLREALAGRNHLVGELSYADIAMAVVFQFVKPVDNRYIRLGAASRACWAEPDLARKYADLLDWRDELYAKHRA